VAHPVADIDAGHHRWDVIIAAASISIPVEWIFLGAGAGSRIRAGLLQIMLPAEVVLIVDHRFSERHPFGADAATWTQFPFFSQGEGHMLVRHTRSWE